MHFLSRFDNTSYLQLLEPLKIKSFRDDAFWHLVERTPGKYVFPPSWDRVIDKSIGQGVEPLLIIDYGNNLYEGGGKPITHTARKAFVDYAKQLVDHYKGRVRLYEIWNEWDMREPKSAQLYVELLRHTYSEIKKVDPEVIVLGGGIGPQSLRNDLYNKNWLDQFVELGGLKYIDGLSVHPYVHCQKQPTPDRYLDVLKTVIAKTSIQSELPIYVTEIGWPTHKGACGLPENTVAMYMIEAFMIAKCLERIKGLWWYDLINDGRDVGNREHNFGIYDNDKQPKSLYDSAALIGQINTETTCINPIISSKEEATYNLKGSGIYSYKELLNKLVTLSK